MKVEAQSNHDGSQVLRFGWTKSHDSTTKFSEDYCFASLIMDFGCIVTSRPSAPLDCHRGCISKNLQRNKKSFTGLQCQDHFCRRLKMNGDEVTGDFLAGKISLRGYSGWIFYSLGWKAVGHLVWWTYRIQQTCAANEASMESKEMPKLLRGWSFLIQFLIQFSK